MFARAYPSLLDAGVALAAGFIGAFATARKDIPAALAGIAIAAALVPPVCTAGLSLALGEMRLVVGALLLFTANIISITLIAAAVFFGMGLRPTRIENTRRRRRYAVLVAGILTIFFMIAGLLNITDQPGVERISEDKLASVFAPARIVDLEIMQDEDPVLVVATVRTSVDLSTEMVKMAQVILSEDLQTPAQLQVVVQRVIDLPPEE
jgi:uncharacterized membrane protein